MIKPASPKTQHYDPAAPTAERLGKGKFARIIPPDMKAGGVRRVLRDLHADPVMRLHADEVIGDIELAAAIKFAELARRAMGPVRLASSGMQGRVDCAGLDDDAQAARDIHARREWDAVRAALRENEFRVLVEILYIGSTIGQSAAAMFGKRWRAKHRREGAVSVLIQGALEGLVKHWGMKGG